jgi:glycosyltransferase involved in cell wall biosynthesis
MSGAPKRILHVVRRMDPGGAETWLMHVLRASDRERLQMDFLVHTREEAAYDREIEARQSRILRCTRPVSSPEYAAEICRLIRRNGPYDAIHSHVYHFSGYLLMLARWLAVPARIAHSHNDVLPQDRAAGCTRRGYAGVMQRLIRSCATHMVGASRVAARALFGASWEKDSRGRVLHCGIDLTSFPRNAARHAARLRARAEWGVEADACLIGHVGRFDQQKNQPFLIEVASEVARRHADVRFVLVGTGPLQEQVRARAAALGISGRVIFAGVRSDVPEVLAAMDAFVFPSLSEGLGLALVEAQAAGLPCVVSSAVPEEADVVPELIRRVSPKEVCSRWADALDAVRAGSRPVPGECLTRVENCDFNIARSTEALYRLYAA